MICRVLVKPFYYLFCSVMSLGNSIHGPSSMAVLLPGICKDVEIIDVCFMQFGISLRDVQLMTVASNPTSVTCAIRNSCNKMV